jgi:hypothetical protein
MTLEDISNSWQHIKKAWQTTCKVVVGTKRGNHQKWITPETVLGVEERREENIYQSKTRVAKQMAMINYNKANSEVKNSMRRIKRTYI